MNGRVWVSVACLAAVVLVAGPAAGQDVYKKGSDIFVTPAGGQTRVDLSQYPVAEAIGGVLLSSEIVSLQGAPIAGLGQTDTVVDRARDVALAVGETATVEVALNGLSLVSTDPVVFDRGNGPEKWDLFVSVSPLVDSTGTITITRSTQDGGSFNAAIDVFPHLVFTYGNEEVRIDCGVDCDAPIPLTSTRAVWVSSDGSFDPTAAGVPKISNGTPYDGDGDGVDDDQFVGGSNWYPGFDPFTQQVVILSHDHPPVAEHAQEANTQCKSSTSTTSADSSTSPSGTLCAVVVEPKEPVAAE